MHTSKTKARIRAARPGQRDLRCPTCGRAVRAAHVPACAAAAAWLDSHASGAPQTLAAICAARGVDEKQARNASEHLRAVRRMAPLRAHCS